MNQNLAILKRGLVLLAILFAFLLIFVAILFNINTSAADARQWAIHSEVVIERTASALLRIVESQSSLRLLVLYSVSHDLRSSLVNLQGFSQELSHSCKGLREIVEERHLPAASRVRALSLIDQDMQSSIHYIQTAVSRLAIISEALLRLSRAGRIEYRCRNVDLNEAVRRIVEAAKNSIAKQGTSIEVQPLPQAWGDPTALEQLFGNLILNAVHYLDPNRKGTIVVRVKPSEDASARTHTYFVSRQRSGNLRDGASSIVPDVPRRNFQGRRDRLDPGGSIRRSPCRPDSR